MEKISYRNYLILKEKIKNKHLGSFSNNITKEKISYRTYLILKEKIKNKHLGSFSNNITKEKLMDKIGLEQYLMQNKHRGNFDNKKFSCFCDNPKITNHTIKTETPAPSKSELPHSQILDTVQSFSPSATVTGIADVLADTEIINDQVVSTNTRSPSVINTPSNLATVETPKFKLGGNWIFGLLALGTVIALAKKSNPKTVTI